MGEIRRKFIVRLGALAACAVLPVHSQQAPFRVVWLSPGEEAEGRPFLGAFRQGLLALGYSEGRSFMLQARWADNSAERAQAQASEAVASRPDVIVAMGPTAYAARRATPSIPVVFAFSGDPVLAGFVRSFAQPAGNLTGMSFLALDIVAKRIEMLKSVMPALDRVAILANPQHPGDEAERRVSGVAASGLGLDMQYFEARGGGELPTALEAIRRSGCKAAVMFPVQSVIANARRIAAWSREHGIATISGWAPFCDAGNLMSYGCSLEDAFGRVAVFVDRILRGTRPSELAVELPRQIELVVNLQAARALGIRVPRAVLLRANRIIEERS